MRTALVWLLAVALVMGSAVGALAQQLDAGDQRALPVELADQPPGYAESGPGFYPYGRDPNDEPTYRFYDGRGWVGPEVDAVVAYIGTMLSLLGVSDGTILIVSLLLSGSDGAEILGQLLDPPVPPLKEPVQTEESPAPPGIDAQNYGLAFSLGASTGAAFNGRVTGDENGWLYKGSSYKSWGGSQHFCKGPGKVSCSFEGEPGAMGRPDIFMECAVTWPRTGKPPAEKAWTAQMFGKLDAIRDKDGNVTGLTSRPCTQAQQEGMGDLPDTDPRKWKCIYPQVVLNPAATSDVVPTSKEDC